MIKKIILMMALILATSNLVAQTEAGMETVAKRSVNTSTPAPTHIVQMIFAKKLASSENFDLQGAKPDLSLEFGVRSDEIVRQALLSLQFTPSPSLIPVESQLKIYLNDELVRVVTITADQLGKLNTIQIPLDPLYIVDFNRLRISFIGHYKSICENPTSSTLWLQVSKLSSLNLTLQKLPLNNDLSYFPAPFFEARDTQPLVLPMVFSGQPSLTQQRAAAILASWFGTKAQWRGQSFPVLFSQMPDRNSIVFVTNKQRPDFLRNYPAITAPTVAMINSPANPYIKLLLIMGRDDDDLVKVVKGIAQGNILFRGQQVVVNNVQQLAPRYPYDAPNWLSTEHPTSFVELQEYKEQLQTSGLKLAPISLNFHLPPDLLLKRDSGIIMKLKYRYSIPAAEVASRLNISLNDSFIKSYDLQSESMHKLPFLDLISKKTLANTEETLKIPAPVGANNKLTFTFDYVNRMTGGNVNGTCEDYSLPNNYALIDGSSTLNISGYHFIAMPNLTAFVSGGFPFSRLADLSQTAILINANSQPVEISALLNILGHIGAQTGYPALGVTLSDDWSQIKALDKDIMIIGHLPAELRQDDGLNLLTEAAQSWIKNAYYRTASSNSFLSMPDSKTTVTATENLAAILGLQSPYHKQRSMIILLAANAKDFILLNNVITDKTKFAAVSGSVAVIRATSVHSLQVGKTYYVGHLPPWQRVWIALQDHPALLALMAFCSVVFLALMLKYGLSLISRARLKPSMQD